jgi:hypothetical protein
MFPELHAVERICTRTPGSLKRLVLIDPDDLASKPDWHLLPSIADLDFAPGKGAYAFEDDRLTGRLDDTTTTNTPAGDFFEYTLSARVRTVRAEMELLRAKLVNRRVHVVATYYNDEQRYVPYMRLSARADSADRPGGRNGYVFTGSARLHKPAPFLNAEIDVIGGPFVPPEEGESLGVTLVELTATDPTYTYNVPAGKWLDGLEIRSTDAQTIKIGTTAGGEELSGMPVSLDALQTYILNGAILDTFGTHTIHFTDLEGTNSIRIWLLG